MFTPSELYAFICVCVSHTNVKWNEMKWNNGERARFRWFALTWQSTLKSGIKFYLFFHFILQFYFKSNRNQQKWLPKIDEKKDKKNKFKKLLFWTGRIWRHCTIALYKYVQVISTHHAVSTETAAQNTNILSSNGCVYQFLLLCYCVRVIQ